jgi:hypothetical protein
MLRVDFISRMQQIELPWDRKELLSSKKSGGLEFS